MLTSYVLPVVREGTEPLLLIGLDPILDRSLHSWEMQHPESEPGNSWLDLIKEPYTVFLPRQLGEKVQLKPGIIRTLEHVHQRRDFRVAEKCSRC